ncbi:MAG: hypothetical protein ABI670_17310 [Chloroflexota bacterium]
MGTGSAGPEWEWGMGNGEQGEWGVGSGEWEQEVPGRSGNRASPGYVWNSKRE